MRLTTNLRSLPTDGHNLIVKTVELLRKEYGIKEGLSVHLKKKIPVAAGMAGGSTDAAAAFAGMNELFDLGMTCLLYTSKTGFDTIEIPTNKGEQHAVN